MGTLLQVLSLRIPTAQQALKVITQSLLHLNTKILLKKEAKASTTRTPIAKALIRTPLALLATPARKNTMSAAGSYNPCACLSCECPGKFCNVPYGNSWLYGVCQSMSSLGSADYTDPQPQYPPGSPEAARQPYYSAMMSGSLGYYPQSMSSESTLSSTVQAGPSGTQQGEQAGYNTNVGMSYDYQGGAMDPSAAAIPDDPIPGPGMQSGQQQSASGSSGGNSGSGSRSHSMASRSTKSGSSSRSHRKSRK